jgi:hypothetical protein
VTHIHQESIRGVGNDTVAEGEGTTQEDVALLEATDRGFDSR